MTRIDQETVDRLAALAAVELTAQERERFKRELQDVLDAFAALSQAASEQTPALPAVPVGTLRDDTIRLGLTIDQVFTNAQHRDGTHLRGPRTIL